MAVNIPRVDEVDFGLQTAEQIFRTYAPAEPSPETLEALRAATLFAIGYGAGWQSRG